MASSPLKQPAIDAMAAILRPLGYRRAGSVFTREVNDVVHLVGLQGSRHSSAREAIYTVNVAVFIPALVDQDVRDFRKPSVWRAHWSNRLGHLAPEQQDTWWTATTIEEARLNGNDIGVKLKSYALPVLDEFGSASALAALWAQGQSPGLTAVQRKEFLAELSAAAPNPSFQRTASPPLN